MNNHHHQLFEFAMKLVDIQIKKYIGLAKIGIGPDARLNARLVFNEVDELLKLIKELTQDIEQLQKKREDKESKVTLQKFNSIFNQIKFYVEQEYTRGYAGWLLDENNIHTPEIKRLEEQSDELKKIATSAKLEYEPSKPATETQYQCEYDSYSIAFKILTLAKEVRLNPKMKFDEDIPMHAQAILRKNADTRYTSEKYSPLIDALYDECATFLKGTKGEKSSSELLLSEAQLHATKHRHEFTRLLTQYNKINPESELFSPEYPWYNVGKIRKAESEKSNVFSFLFKFTIGIGVSIGVYMLISYFNQAEENNLDMKVI